MRYVVLIITVVLGQLVALGLGVRSFSDLPETLLFGVLSGLFCAATTGVAFLFLSDLWSKVICQHRTQPWWWLAVLISLLSVGFLALVAAILGKYLAGLLPVVATGLLLGALGVAIWRGGGSARMAYGLGALSLLGAIGVFGTLPLRERPLYRGAHIEGEAVRIVSWNLGLGQPGSAPSPERYRDEIAATLNELKPDVVLLQEVSSAEYLEKLRSGLGSEWRGGRSRPESGMATAVLARLDGEFSAPRTDAPFGGPAVFSGSVHSALRFVSVHLPPERQAKMRFTYASELKKLFPLKEGSPLVIGGDLNIDTDSWWDNRAGVFTDSIAIDIETLGVLGAMGNDAGIGTAPTAVMSRRIDRIFVPPDSRALRYEVVKGKRRGRMDHDPIVVDVIVSNPSGHVK